MRVFLTGGTGYVGSAVLDALVRGGHEATVLVRTPEGAQQMLTRGVRAVLGDLASPSRYVGMAEECDAIIHTAFDRSKAGVDIDLLASDALIAAGVRRAAAGHPASFLYTSGVWVLGDTTEAAEDAPVAPTPLVAWRPAREARVLGSAGGGLRTAVIRPGVVFGGARGIVGDLLRDAANGLIRIVGDGRNRWPCVYDRDLADLYVRVAVSPGADGIFHANDEADEQVVDIVEAIARQARTTPDIRHMPIEEARTKMGPFADALALNQTVRSPRARALGWAPTLSSVAGNVARLFEEFRTAAAA